MSPEFDLVSEFLTVATPPLWVTQASAIERRAELLIDHANSEKKAAGTALSLLYRYVDKPELLTSLSRLAREELSHFELVTEHLRREQIDYIHISPSRYARGLRELVAQAEPWRLVDTLIVGAVVEARSCERFALLAGRLDEPLARFYGRLLAAEARHFQDYLELARRYAPGPIDEHVERVLARDAQLVTQPDDVLRFHSGPLVDADDQGQVAS